ncbi:aquaporin-8 isoform X2 [Apteryx mantelli]|uniref:Aquaporin-8 isoform X2 n=1 Tax=Apteryx mantelli TaxID=2696672 RepID=A0ABM4FBB9_9AVES
MCEKHWNFLPSRLAALNWEWKDCLVPVPGVFPQLWDVSRGDLVKDRSLVLSQRAKTCRGDLFLVSPSPRSAAGLWCQVCSTTLGAGAIGALCFVPAPLMATEEHGPTTLKEMQVDEVPRLQPPKPNWYERYVQPCVAELLGSALFIFIGCASVIENVEGTGRLQPALAHGLALGLSIAVLGNISGGHFNPAVSLGAWLVGALHITMLLPYWVSQLCGGVIGAALAKAATAGERYANASGGAVGSIAADGQVPAALAGEIVMTAFLVLAVCMGALNEKTRTPLAPFCIGFTVTADILAGLLLGDRKTRLLLL